MAALAQIEERFPVDRWRVGDVPIWPLTRLRWMFAEWARLYTSAPPARSAAGGRLHQLLSGPAHLRQVDRADPTGRDTDAPPADIVFLSDGISFSCLDGRWVERFCDPLRARATRRGLRTTLWMPGARPPHPRHSPSRLIQTSIDRANLGGALRALAGGGASALPGLRDVTAWVASQGLGAALLSEARIRSDVLRVQAIARAHERRLRHSQARLAFIVGYYSIEGMGFVLACHRCGIPVVDIQHGVQGELHPAYAAWRLPTDGRVHPLLPHRFWLWSTWEQDVVARWATGTGHAAVVGGNPWLDVWGDGAAWPGAIAASKAARDLRAQAAGRPVALVTLQYGLVDGDQLDPLVELVRSDATRFVFWVRLHPLMLDRREAVRARLAAAGVRVELDVCTDLPLHAVLPYADVHLTHSSSTAIEAAQFGLRTVLTSDYGAELFTPLIDAGSVVVETGPTAALASTLSRLATDRSAEAAGTLPGPDAAFERLLAETGLDKEGR